MGRLLPSVQPILRDSARALPQDEGSWSRRLSEDDRLKAYI